MIEQPDMFTYPQQPGYKACDTSRVAAEEIAPRAKTLRDKVLNVLKYHSLTADEIAAALGKSVLATRPRVSELVCMNLIWNTGRTRKNQSGIRAIVWEGLP